MRYAHKPLALPMLLACFIVLLSSATTYALPSFKEFANSDLGKELDSKLQKKITAASDEQTGKKLLEAAKYGDTDIIKKLIAKGADVDVRDEQGFTPLFLAAINGKAEAARVLIEAKAGIDRVEKYNNTPLCYAAMNNHPEVAEILINAGANINVQNIIGDTPLILALKKNAKQVATTLLYNNADPDIKNKNNMDAMSLVSDTNQELKNLIFSKSKRLTINNSSGATPLIKAVQDQNLERINYLIDIGANPNDTDTNNRTPLWHAIVKNNADIYDTLIKRGASLEKVYHPMLLAAEVNACNIIKRLLAAGIDSNYKDSNLITALMQAAGYSNKEAVVLLLENGAGKTINQQRHDGQTAIYVAAEYAKDNDIIKILLQNGADPNILPYNGKSILFVSNNPEVTKILIDAGVNPNTKDNEGYAPVMTTDLKKLEILLASGANPNTATKSGLTPLSSVLKLDNTENENRITEIVRILLKYGANPSQAYEGGCGKAALFWGIAGKHYDSVKLMLENGADPNLRSVTHDNRTTLMWCGTQAMADILIKAGADINAVDSNGKSVLDYASESENQTLFRFLESKGADVDRLNSDGETQLMTAIRQGNTLEVQSLIQKHADPFAGKESIPFVAAIRLKNSELVSELLKNVKDINAPALGGYTPLTLAVSEQNNVATQQILAKKANVNQSDANGATALGIALVNKNRDLTETLIKAGADVNQVQGGQFTPLFIAATNNDIESMKILLAAGAEANDPSAVYGTVKNNNPQALQLLLDAGADPTIKNEDNKGFLDFAKENKANDVKKVLKSALKKYKNKTTK